VTRQRERFLSSDSLFLSLFCRFRIDNTDHIVDLKTGTSGYDTVNIFCPVNTAGEFLVDEKYVIYMVNKEEYDTCRVMTRRPRIIAQCDQPEKAKYYTISIRVFSPFGGLEFRPGKDYYLISTSSREDLHLRSGGMCRSNNMKMVFKVYAEGYRPTRTTSTTSTTAKPAMPPPLQNDFGRPQQRGKFPGMDFAASPRPPKGKPPKAKKVPAKQEASTSGARQMPFVSAFPLLVVVLSLSTSC